MEKQELTIGNSKVSVGRFSYGFENISLMHWGEDASLTIGSFCSLATNITIFLGGNHRTDWVTTYPFGYMFPEVFAGQDIKGHPATKGPVTVGSDVWIAHGVTIMSGVTVGDGAVLAANATIVRDVAPYEIVAGNPAKHVRFRFTPEIRDLLYELRWWDAPVERIKAMAPALSARPDPATLRAWLRDKNWSSAL